MGRDLRVTAPPVHDHTWNANPQHPQPQSAQVSSGTILPFHSAPISQRPATAHPSTEHLPHRPAPSSIEELHQSGISPYRPMSAHSSLYRQLRNPSPVPHVSQSLIVTIAVTGQMRSSSTQDERARIHHKQWARIDRQLRSEPQPPPELLVPPES